MAATMTERLDELLALAANAGRLGNESVAAESAHMSARPGDMKRRARERMYAARKEWESAEKLLASARKRFLSDPRLSQVFASLTDEER